MEGLLEQIKVVVHARQVAKEAQELKDKAFNDWYGANNHLYINLELASNAQDEAETRLRELTIMAYHETGSKTPALGVGIRELTKLEYEPKEALKWALEHKISLALDKKSFEGFAKATPLDFVKVYTELQATIATDLSAAVEKQKEVKI